MNFENMFCLFERPDHSYRRVFKLAANNEIDDIDSKGNPNERYWDFKNSKLNLYNFRNIRTSIYILEKEEVLDDGYKLYYFSGKNNKDIKLNITMSDSIDVVKKLFNNL
ncbi:MAG: hypothetical protein IKO41_00890 [Lachnospiraceae bacterium]|nr:hypothetical protein [Lachnospiraceae bacterium]